MKIISLGLFLAVSFFLVSCEDDCIQDCSASPSCDLVPDPGDCLAAIPKYYFDKEEGRCKEFTWGGCGGVVPFDTMEECRQCECDD